MLKHINDPIEDRDMEWSKIIQAVCDRSHLPSYVEKSVFHFYLHNREMLWGARRLEAITALTHLYSTKLLNGRSRPLEKLCEQAYADRRLVGRYLFRYGTEV